MIKVGKILEIRRFLGDFFDFFAFVDFFVGDFGSSSEHSEQLGFFGVGILGALGATRSTRILEEMVGTGVWLGLALASFSECSECSECSDDKKVWGGGFGIFFLWGLGFFCKFAEMYVFFEKEIIEIFLII